MCKSDLEQRLITPSLWPKADTSETAFPIYRARRLTAEERSKPLMLFIVNTQDTVKARPYGCHPGFRGVRPNCSSAILDQTLGYGKRDTGLTWVVVAFTQFQPELSFSCIVSTSLQLQVWVY